MKALRAFITLFFLASPAFSSEDPQLFLKNAHQALGKNDRKKADFYAARWMGVCKEETDACHAADMTAFLKKRKLQPKAFIPAEWDPSFLEWFEKSVRERWGAPAPRVRESARSFEITQGTFEDRYFVTVVLYPELELWHTLKDGLVSKAMVLPMGSYKDRPMLFFGKTLKGSVLQARPMFLDTRKRTLHNIWKPEFADADGGGEPEVWLRFSLAYGNGFIQVLDVYKIKDGQELALLKRFESQPNGYVRRREDGTVDASGEIWKYEAGDFRSVEKTPFKPSLDSPNWRKNYLE
jgi:hypothetical protein